MRILHICADQGIPVDGTKGASIHLRSLAEAFGREHEVTVATARRPSESVAGPFSLSVCGPENPLAAIVDRYGVPDVVYERYSLGHGAGLRLARDLGRPFVLEVNAPLVAEAERHRPTTVGPDDAATETELFREADLVVAVSSPLRRYVAERRGGGPVIVVHNGCDPELFLAGPGPDPVPTLGFLGHPKPWHGATGLPDVVRRLRTRGHAVRLLVVGGGTGADDVSVAAEAVGVADAIEITGPLDHCAAARAIGRAWIGVAPYPADPFCYFSPLKIVEYLAAGLPVVATAVGDVPGLVGNGGLVVAPDDIDALVDAIERLLTDAERRAVFGSAGRARVESELTWAAVASRTLEAMRPLVVGGVR